MRAESIAITNKMRYATSDKSPTNLYMHNIEQIFASNSVPSKNQVQMKQIWPEDNEKFHKGRLLDEEDERLLEKFYRETKDSDPFHEVWDENNAKMKSNNSRTVFYDYRVKDQNRTLVNEGWTIEPDYLAANQTKQDNHTKSSHPEDTVQPQSAKYSPTLKLLTSYIPTERINDGQMEGGRITGATLFGQDQNRAPEVSSNSAIDAINLHDDMLRNPPRDGKVRVRMYYHRAIHDDDRLYGTGPWKYWGHGWGLEFGYDPTKKQDDKDKFYQKGYTIERAFGRDFCKDKTNCRQPDPEFFKDPKNVGVYSKHHFTKEKKKSRTTIPQRNTHGRGLKIS